MRVVCVAKSRCHQRLSALLSLSMYAFGMLVDGDSGFRGACQKEQARAKHAIDVKCDT